MKIAVLANPGAGGGGKGRQVLEKIRQAWSKETLFGAAGFGGEALPACVSPERPEAGYLPALKQAVALLLKEEPDLLVTVGGDGTAAYAAEEVLAAGKAVPILGIGTGTANVGPIVSFRAEDELPDPADLTEKHLGAIEVMTLSGRHIAYGFNDLVLGNTFLGTDENGRTVTFEAGTLAGEGRLVKAAPLAEIFADGPCFAADGRQLPAAGFPVAQLIASTLEEENYYGRAVTGLWCYTPASPSQGAVYITPVPVVSMEESSAGFESWLVGGQFLLSPGQILRVSGLKKEVCAVADGNPYRIPQEGIAIRYVPELIKVYRRR